MFFFEETTIANAIDDANPLIALSYNGSRKSEVCPRRPRSPRGPRRPRRPMRYVPHMGTRKAIAGWQWETYLFLTQRLTLDSI